MKIIFQVAIALSLNGIIHAQGVGINLNGQAPSESAILDASSSDKGFLPPRMSMSERNSIEASAIGLTIFNTTTNCVQWWNGCIWYDACSGSAYMYPEGSVFENNKATEVVCVTSLTGRVWMDRNLGASRAATSFDDPLSFGYYYQWGRFSDGHQIKSSATTSTLSTTDTPGHGLYIVPPSNPRDWRASRNNTLWNGVNGINNPCPNGFRLPTQPELSAERLSWNSPYGRLEAFNSPLKLPTAGIREHLQNGAVIGVGEW